MNRSSDSEQALFFEALEKPAGRIRSEYVRQHCGPDIELRQRIESLLAAHEETGDLLDHMDVETNGGSNIMGLLGTSVGPYKIREQIGEGGFGVVYVAEQDQPIRRKVALKVIKPGMDSKEIIARFEAERQALAMMDHPNVARVLDAGTTETGHPFFVMELVRGVAITEFCDKERLSTNERLKLFIDVCLAVEHAHQKGIIHRDIKPNNVLITLHDGRPVAKVIDFGVAKALHQKLTEKTVYTSIGQMIGTPMYMSPEQAEMSGLDVDTRSDVYSLGVLLYELLTGSTPFDRKTIKEAGLDGMRRIIQETQPIKPSARVSTLESEQGDTISDRCRVDARRLEQTLRGDLDWVVLKALEKDRNRRYESVRAFVSDVERYFAGEPVEACPPSVVYRLRKFLGRHRAFLATLMLVFVALCLGLSVAIKERRVAIHAKILAENRLEVLQIQKERIEALLYTTDIRLAAKAVEELDVAQARLLLDRHLPSEETDDFRGIEWEYLMKKVQRSTSSQAISTRALYDICLSNNRKLVAVAGADAVVRIFQAESLVRVIDFDSKQTEVNGLVFSPDDQKIISAGDDGTLRVWNAVSGKLLKSIRFGSEKAYRVLVNSPCTDLIACGETPEVRVFDFESGQLVRTLRGHDRSVEDIALSPDGRLLASASSDGRRCVWNWMSGQRVYRSSADPNRKTCITFSADGRFLVDAGIDGNVRVTSVANFKWQHRHHLPGPIQSIAFAPKESAIAVGSRDGVIRLLDIDALIGLPGMHANWPATVRESEQVWSSHPERVYGLTWFGSDSLFSVGDKGTLRETWIGDDAILWRTGPEFQCDLLSSTPDGRFVANIRSGVLTVFDRNQNVRMNLDGFPRDATWTAASISPDGRHLMATTDDGRFVTASFPSLDLVNEQELPDKPNIWGARFSGDGQRLLLICRLAGLLHIVSFPSGKRECVVRMPNSRDAVLSPNGRYLAANDARTLQVIDLNSNDLVATSARHHDESIQEIQFTPDGRSLVTTADDRTVKIWDWENQGVPELIGAHGSGQPSGLAITKDGRTLLTCSQGGELIFWNLATRQKLFRLTDHRFHRLWLSGNNRILFTVIEGERLAWVDFDQRQTRSNQQNISSQNPAPEERKGSDTLE